MPSASVEVVIASKLNEVVPLSLQDANGTFCGEPNTESGAKKSMVAVFAGNPTCKVKGVLIVNPPLSVAVMTTVIGGPGGTLTPGASRSSLPTTTKRLSSTVNVWLSTLSGSVTASGPIAAPGEFGGTAVASRVMLSGASLTSRMVTVTGTITLCPAASTTVTSSTIGASTSKLNTVPGASCRLSPSTINLLSDTLKVCVSAESVSVASSTPKTTPSSFSGTS